MSLDSLPSGLERSVRAELERDENLQWVGRPAVSRFVVATLPVAFFGLFFAGFAAFWIASEFEMTKKHKEFDRKWNDGRDQMDQRQANVEREWNENRDQMERNHGRDPWREKKPAPANPPRQDEDGFSFHDLFPLFGLIFLVVGLGMVLSPVWAARKALATVYVVTDRRAVIFDGGWSTHVRSFEPAELGHIERRQRGNGSGDIILAKEPAYVPGHYSGTAGRGGHYVSGYWTTREIGFFGIPHVKQVEQLLRAITVRGNESIV